MLKHYFLSLIYYKKRTILSIIGIMIGIMILIVVLSLGKSLKNYLTSQLSVFGPKILFISPKPPGLNEVASLIAYAQGIKVTTLKEKDLKEILKLKLIDGGVANVFSASWIKYQEREVSGFFLGTLADYPQIDQSFKLSQGRMFNERENESLAKVAVIGASIKEKLFKNQTPIGKFIKIKNQNFKVIGVLKKRGSFGFMDFDLLVFLPLKTAQKLLLGIDYFSEIDLKLRDLKFTEIAKEKITQILRKNHHISDPKKDDFQISSAQEIIQRTQHILTIINLLVFVLAAVSLIVGGIGVMNMMLISVLKRTKEIGLRKAVGARKKDIFFQFLIETSFITILGTFLGIILGLGISLFISFIFSHFISHWPIAISFFSLFLGMILGVVEGIIFGLWPAYKASLKSPLASLRSEI